MKGLAKLLCPEKTGVLRLIASVSKAATVNSTRSTPFGSVEEKRCHRLQKDVLNRQMSFVSPSKILFSISFLLFCSLQALEWAPIPLDEPGHEWMERAAEEEFYSFRKTGISSGLLERTWDCCQRSGVKFDRFRVINSEVYGPEGKMRRLLEAIVRHYPLPDIDFIYCRGDALFSYISKRSLNFEHAPILVSAKKKEADREILFADWYYDIDNLKATTKDWNVCIELLQSEGHRWPWSEKIDKVVWRGNASDGKYSGTELQSYPRGAIVYHSKRYPDLVDAGFVLWKSKDPKKFQGLLADSMSIIEQTQFKYQIIVDGKTCTYPGTQWRLYSGCLSFMQKSDNEMWFFRELVPYEHYVPVENNMSDLTAKIWWARENDDRAEEIALNAQDFAKTHLMPQHILLYCYRILLKYASLQRFQPKGSRR